LVGDRTNEIGLDNALGTATITAHDVPVITFFTLVEDAVAAARTGIGLETSLRNVGCGPSIRQRDCNSRVPAAALADATTSGPNASGSADAVATHSPTNDRDLTIASSEEKPKAHSKPTVGQAPKGPIRERKGKGHPPGPSTLDRDRIGNSCMHTRLVPRPWGVLN
jgi:hypothetical protein